MTAISEARSARWRRSGVLVARLFLLLLLWIVLPEAARAVDCGQNMAPPLVTVRAPVRAATYDLSKGIAALSNDRNLAVPRGLEDFKYAFGVTAVETRGETRWQLNSRPSGDGGTCWWISNLSITITAHTKVYIAKEVPRGSCLWKEVNAHEAQHVQMDQRLFPRLPDAIRPKIVRAVAHAFPARDFAEADALWRKIINDTLAGAVQEFRTMRNEAQLTIDTREAYSHPNRVCGNAAIAAAISKAGLR